MFLQHKILSGETVLSAYTQPHMHACTPPPPPHTHTFDTVIMSSCLCSTQNTSLPTLWLCCPSLWRSEPLTPSWWSRTCNSTRLAWYARAGGLTSLTVSVCLLFCAVCPLVVCCFVLFVLLFAVLCFLSSCLLFYAFCLLFCCFVLFVLMLFAVLCFSSLCCLLFCPLVICCFVLFVLVVCCFVRFVLLLFAVLCFLSCHCLLFCAFCPLLILVFMLAERHTVMQRIITVIRILLLLQC